MDSLLHLIAFRQQVYEKLGSARDAVFELGDAVLSTPSANSFAELSLSPFFRRRWPSLYEAIEDARLDRHELMSCYVEQDIGGERPVLIGDHSPWSRLSAPTLAERTHEHQATRATHITGGDPITVGFGYATIALLPDLQQNWVLPLLHERIGPHQTPLQVAARQLKAVVDQLQGQGAARAVALYDSQYGCAPFLELTAQIEADLLFRLKSNRCLYGVPPPYPGKGPPFKHGATFKLNDASSWWQPDEQLDLVDKRLGRVRLRRWRRLHFAQVPERELTLMRIECLDKPKKPPLWLGWVGQAECWQAPSLEAPSLEAPSLEAPSLEAPSLEAPSLEAPSLEAPSLEAPSLEQLWRLYLKRFAIEHWYRFIKQRLYWTLPRFSTPEQCDRWSDLMCLLTHELFLARQVVGETHLPWQKPAPLERRSPGRVCQAMAGLLALIGTPARAPKQRGRSPGWQPGSVRRGRDRHPIKKKSNTSRRKRRKRSK